MAGLRFRTLLDLLHNEHERELTDLRAKLQYCEAQLSAEGSGHDCSNGTKLRQSCDADNWAPSFVQRAAIEDCIDPKSMILLQREPLDEHVPNERRPLMDVPQALRATWAEYQTTDEDDEKTCVSDTIAYDDGKDLGGAPSPTSDGAAEEPTAEKSEEKSRRKKPRRNSSLFDLVRGDEPDGNFVGFGHEWLEKVNELKKWFDHLDVSKHRYLTAENVQDIMRQVHGKQMHDLDWVRMAIDTFTAAVSQIDRGAGVQSMILCSSPHAGLQPSFSRSFGSQSRMSASATSRISRSTPTGRLSFVAFAELILWNDVVPYLVSEGMCPALEIRDSLIKHSIDELIVQHSRLDMPKHETIVGSKDWYIDHVIEPSVAFVIMTNAVIIGLSADIASDGWLGVECFFTAFFVSEILLKISISGVVTHFFKSSDFLWNLFDTVVVLFAIVDLIITNIAGGSNQMQKELGDATMLRMARLARLTRIMRLLRLLRLRCFKELMLMVKGVVAGMRTLFWAFVLLMSVVYVVAIVLRQTIGEDPHRMEDNTVLFESVPWSMFIVFRCFTGDCTLPNGTPLATQLYARHGWTFGIPYIIVTLFITFGICNLIMAIFVENVAEAAKTKRQLSREDECARVCRGLRSLILKFGEEARSEGKEDDPDFVSRRESSSARKILTTMITTVFLSKRYIRNKSVAAASSLVRGTLGSGTLAHTASESPEGANNMAPFFQFGGQISRKQFQKVMEHRDTHNLLDDLDIHVCDRGDIFDVLDSDSSGFVDVSELISGLLKLRTGGADKSDSVATILGIRSLRKQLDTLSTTLSEHHEVMRDLAMKITPLAGSSPSGR